MISRSSLRVRYAETDQMGVAHHANYPVWFEVGRSEWLRALGMSYRDVEARGYYLMLSALHVQYKRAAKYEDQLTLETTVQEVRSRKLVFTYRLLRAEEGTDVLLATGSTEHIVTDHTYRLASLPPDVHAVLQSGVNPER